MRRVILLDVMGTLVYDPFHVEMPAFFGMSLEELLRAKHRDAWVRFERGELDEAAFLASFFADGRAYDHRGFVARVRETYRYLDGVEPLLARLAAGPAELHALSNYPCWFQMIEERLGLGRYLAWSFVSCQTGVRKPDPEAYLGPARRLGVEPGECLFVDDRPKNVDAARAVGMDGVVFEDAAQLERALATRGLLP